MRMPSPDCVQGYKHGDAGAWFALSTGRYLYRAGARRAQTIVTCLSFPVVCDWWCLAMNRPLYFFLKPSFNPFFLLWFLFSPSASKIFKEYLPKCSRLKWESTLVPMGDVKTVKVSKEPCFPQLCFHSALTSPLKCCDADSCGFHLLGLANQTGFPTMSIF